MLAMKPSRSKVIGANDNKKTSVSKNQKHSKNTTDECSAQNACGSSNETRSVYIDALKEKLKCKIFVISSNAIRMFVIYCD